MIFTALVKMLVLMVKRNEIREVIMKIGRIWPTEIVNDEKIITMRFLTQRLNFFGNGKNILILMDNTTTLHLPSNII